MFGEEFLEYHTPGELDHVWETPRPVGINWSHFMASNDYYERFDSNSNKRKPIASLHPSPEHHHHQPRPPQPSSGDNQATYTHISPDPLSDSNDLLTYYPFSSHETQNDFFPMTSEPDSLVPSSTVSLPENAAEQDVEKVKFEVPKEMEIDMIHETDEEESEREQDDVSYDESQAEDQEDFEGPDSALIHAEVGENGPSFKLKTSKSPIMDALVFCALKGWGLRLLKEEGDDIQFMVDDFHLYYRYSARICAKQNPTDDQASRIKALKRWFPDFPSRRDRGKIDESFLITVQKGTKKDNKPKKMQQIIERNKRLLGLVPSRKVRRTH